MKKNMIILIVFFVLFLFLDINAEIEEQTKNLEVNGRDINAKVIASFSGTDIIVNDNEQINNITVSTPGENLFPQIFEGKSKYYISWIQYEKGNVKLYLYDSYLNSSRILIEDDFEFIGNAKPLYWKGRLRALLFLGLKGENDDIYIYDIFDGTYKNISNTSGFEKTFDLNIIEGEIYIDVETSELANIYWINPNNLNVKLINSKLKEKSAVNVEKTLSGYSSYNKMVAFGDSITWGKIRMKEFKSPDQEWTDIEYNPELTYWGQLETLLKEEYGELSPTINLGVNRETASEGRDRMDIDFARSDAYFCFIMFGTNDVGNNEVSMISTATDIEWMLKNARDTYGMYPIGFAIPPQQNKLLGSTLQYYKNRTEILNKLILEIEGFPIVDTYKAFFESEEGWQECLEDYKGNHPSPLGHRYIMDLIKPIILSMPPRSPDDVIINSRGSDNIVVGWNKNVEFDFDEYEIEYGFFKDQLNRSFDTDDLLHTFYKNFINSSFQPKLYFKIRSVDKDGNKSEFSKIFSFDM